MLPDEVPELEELWYVDDDCECDGGEEVAKGALLEVGPRRAEGVLLVHEERMANGKISIKKKGNLSGELKSRNWDLAPFSRPS